MNVDQPEFLHNNFMGIPPELSAYESTAFVIIPIPYDATTSYMAGTRFGPRAIIAASQQVETYDHEVDIDACEVAGIHTFAELETGACNPESMLAQAQGLARRVLEHGKRPVVLGGEHTVSLAPARAALGRHADLSVLQIDAHLDLRETYQGSPLSHACVMKRLQDEGAHVVNVAGRAWSAAEQELVRRRHADLFTMPRIRRETDWQDQLMDRLREDVYLTVDLDGLDPTIMPAVGTPEPGGLCWWETVELLDRVVAEKNVVAFDVVELCPVPGLVHPDMTAARLTYRLISRIAAKSAAR